MCHVRWTESFWIKARILPLFIIAFKYKAIYLLLPAYMLIQSQTSATKSAMPSKKSRLMTSRLIMRKIFNMTLYTLSTIFVKHINRTVCASTSIKPFNTKKFRAKSSLTAVDWVIVFFAPFLSTVYMQGRGFTGERRRFLARDRQQTVDEAAPPTLAVCKNTTSTDSSAAGQFADAKIQNAKFLVLQKNRSIFHVYLVIMTVVPVSLCLPFYLLTL